MVSVVLPIVLFLSVSSPTSGADVKNIVNELARHLQAHRQTSEHRVRTDGSSGLKQLRLWHSGTNNFETESHTGNYAAAVHDHADSKNIAGMGENVAVLNGVEFQTRHNDYFLVKPSESKSSKLHDVEAIAFPDVPDSVKKAGKADAQVVEMQKWFDAWAKQSKSPRDYTKHFKPLLCYLEGAWFHSSADAKITLKDDSMRHKLGADTYANLYGANFYYDYSGFKNPKENTAGLPSGVIADKTGLKVKQWNYRILCHPIKGDLPLSHIHEVEDLSGRFFKTKVDPLKIKMSATRAGRFGLNSQRSATPGGQYQYGLLDELMAQVPGKDNYKGKIRSAANILDHTGKQSFNQAYYHRWQTVKGKGLGLVSPFDEYVFGARTNDKAVVADANGERWSWAVPLEIIYLTPLHNWNPHGIAIKSTAAASDNNKRNGGCSTAKAYKSAAETGMYYLTPYNFFKDGKAADPNADTTRDKVCVLDSKSKMHEMRASGIFVQLPEIANVAGQLRTRYPIYSVAGEGSPTWKELNALKVLVLNPKLQEGMDKNVRVKNTKGYRFTMASSSKGVTPHAHSIMISEFNYLAMLKGQTINGISSQAIHHTHTLKMKKQGNTYIFTECDGEASCAGHPHDNTIQSPGESDEELRKKLMKDS